MHWLLIARIDLWEVQQRVIHLDVSNQKISELQLSPQTIQSLLIKQNMVVDPGCFEQGEYRYPMHLSGEFKKRLLKFMNSSYSPNSMT